MLKNENIICISSIDWDFVWQGHQEIMSVFAKNNNKVLFIENTGVRVPNFSDIQRLKKRLFNWLRSAKGFREEARNLYIYSPIILPFPYSRIVRWINRHLIIGALKRWMRMAGFHDPIIWTFLPTGTALDIINNLDSKLLIYYCIADFYELVSNPKKIKKTEDEVIRKSNLIFAQGIVLKDRCSRLNDNVHIFPFGVRIEQFENLTHGHDKAPSDMRGIKRPIIGYIGGIHKHIDFKLIRYIAEARPDWSLVLAGPIQTDISEIGNLKNIYLMGKKEFSSLPNYINEFDVGIVPYKISDYTVTVYPTKLNEYHALGKPVVSTSLPEIKNFNTENDNLVFVGKTYEEFVNCISLALRGSDPVLVNKRISSARKNSWSIRIEEMSDLIKKAIEKKSGIPLNWREDFLRLYKVTRSRILKLILISSSVYILLFYTPLVWFLASPLKIALKPEKSDAIVVFAGGVGESGKPGQGYEERVQYAVELYKKGYAPYMIFSSGYTYVFEEPLMMKVLAVNLGVPQEAIILETKAKNTYENVKFTKQILLNMKLSKILLVSSPYHMRRVFLTFHKLAPELKTIYTPVPKSIFYAHSIEGNNQKEWRQVSLEQLEGLLHEYLGIIYYLLKGYI